MSGSYDRAEDREANAQRMREYRHERGLEYLAEPDVLPSGQVLAAENSWPLCRSVVLFMPS